MLFILAVYCAIPTIFQLLTIKDDLYISIKDGEKLGLFIRYKNELLMHNFNAFERQIQNTHFNKYEDRQAINIVREMFIEHHMKNRNNFNTCQSEVKRLCTFINQHNKNTDNDYKMINEIAKMSYKDIDNRMDLSIKMIFNTPMKVKVDYLRLNFIMFELVDTTKNTTALYILSMYGEISSRRATKIDIANQWLAVSPGIFIVVNNTQFEKANIVYIRNTPNATDSFYLNVGDPYKSINKNDPEWPTIAMANVEKTLLFDFITIKSNYDEYLKKDELFQIIQPNISNYQVHTIQQKYVIALELVLNDITKIRKYSRLDSELLLFETLQPYEMLSMLSNNVYFETYGEWSRLGYEMAFLRIENLKLFTERIEEYKDQYEKEAKIRDEFTNGFITALNVSPVKKTSVVALKEECAVIQPEDSDWEEKEEEDTIKYRNVIGACCLILALIIGIVLYNYIQKKPKMHTENNEATQS
ncbi:hypothetical protein ECANGB1_1652 [Enterospora canceri]|uniref:Uncharacterized protein n=1 Tax=Enterospora canceri TaxID=1081671 RepID=A0A1Y1SAC6_9MICR|nr:hypothetical protein ECANGB1_1652 [Enterospora canceri]